MRMCIFSTPTSNLSMQSFVSLGLRPTCIEMNADKQKQDCEIFINGVLQENPSLAPLPDDLKADIIQELLSKAHGHSAR